MLNDRNIVEMWCVVGILELMNEAKLVCEKKQPLRLTNDTMSELDIENTEDLFISHDYTGNIPNLNNLSRLKVLHINRNLSVEEFERLDLSAIEDLYVSFSCEVKAISIIAPRLKKLTVSIANNEDHRLSAFDTISPYIDISRCGDLEELTLIHCTGYKLVGEQFDCLRGFVCVDCRYWNFDLLKRMQNLTAFVATGCELSDIGFLNGCCTPASIDLTYNRITNADLLFSLSGLEELKIYRNPLEDPQKYYSLLCDRVYVTDKDRDFLAFLSSVWVSRNMAYMAIHNARQPDKKRPAVVQHMYDRLSDEKIFAKHFARRVKENIEYHTSAEKNYRVSALLTADELRDYILREYPFVEEYWR